MGEVSAREDHSRLMELAVDAFRDVILTRLAEFDQRRARNMLLNLKVLKYSEQLNYDGE